jgi:hypothetical protein
MSTRPPISGSHNSTPCRSSRSATSRNCSPEAKARSYSPTTIASKRPACPPVTRPEERMPADAATTKTAADTRRRRTPRPRPRDQRSAPRPPRAASRERRTDPGSPRSRFDRRTRTAAPAGHRRGIVPAVCQPRHAADQPNRQDPEQDHPAQPRTSSAHDRLRPTTTPSHSPSPTCIAIAILRSWCPASGRSTS